MARKNREINHRVKVLHEAARALEHAARCVSEAEETIDGLESLGFVTPKDLVRQASELLAAAKITAVACPLTKSAWDGDLELEV